MKNTGMLLSDVIDVTALSGLTFFQSAETILELLNSPHMSHLDDGMELHIDAISEEKKSILGISETTYSFRIPKDGNSNPIDNDRLPSYRRELIQRIGVSGWDYVNKCSRFVVIDIDSDDGHDRGLSDECISKLIDKLKNIPWLAIYRSKSGKGYHLYVHLDGDRQANVRSDHIAIAGYVQECITEAIGVDLSQYSDAVGMLAWIFDIDAAENGFEQIKKAEINLTLREGWRDVGLSNEGELEFRNYVSQQVPQTFGKEQKEIIDWLNKNGWPSQIVLIEGRYILKTHTKGLSEAHIAMGLAGDFETISKGSNPSQPNCFAFAGENGDMLVCRYNQGCKEHESWSQDGKGWTTCSYNKKLSFKQACAKAGAIKNSRGNYVCSDHQVADNLFSSIGQEIDFPIQLLGKQIELIRNDGSITLKIRVPREISEIESSDWLYYRRHYERDIAFDEISEKEYSANDCVRYLVSPHQEEIGFYFKDAKGRWIAASKENVKSFLSSKGFDRATSDLILGKCISENWTLANEPFIDEYPEDGIWNRNAPRLSYEPTLDMSGLQYPHWEMIFEHCGKGLDKAVRANQWCIDNKITTGKNYLLLWVASMFQKPKQSLPYLFFYRDGKDGQQTGKSTFLRAINLLLTRGCVDAKHALSEHFNGQLVGAVLCYIEEIKLEKSSYAKIKSWVDDDMISIRDMHTKAYMVENNTHWIQTANDRGACPIEEGDTRIVVIKVPSLPVKDQLPWKTIFMPKLQKEAPDFIAEILNLDLPFSSERLYLPTLVTDEKRAAIDPDFFKKKKKSSITDEDELVRAILDYVYPTITLEYGEDNREYHSFRSYSGSTGTFLEELGEGPWPKDPGAFSKVLKNIQSTLSEMHIGLSRASDGKRDSKRSMTIGPVWEYEYENSTPEEIIGDIEKGDRLMDLLQDSEDDLRDGAA